MDLQIEKLLEKYWQGETSIAEEQTLKTYFKENPELSTEAQYFGHQSAKQLQLPARSFLHPGKTLKLTWLSIAAAVLFGIMIIPFIFESETTTEQFAVEDPKEAFEITRESLLMVSNRLNKAKTYSGELKKFNKAKTVIINQ